MLTQADPESQGLTGPALQQGTSAVASHLSLSQAVWGAIGLASPGGSVLLAAMHRVSAG